MDRLLLHEHGSLQQLCCMSKPLGHSMTFRILNLLFSLRTGLNIPPHLVFALQWPHATPPLLPLLNHVFLSLSLTTAYVSELPFSLSVAYLHASFQSCNEMVNQCTLFVLNGLFQSEVCVMASFCYAESTTDVLLHNIYPSYWTNIPTTLQEARLSQEV
jgi:hypothetical protein